MKYILTHILILCLFTLSYPQVKLEKTLSGEYNPLEIISIDQNASFDQAVKMLSSVSEQITGKTIISTVSSTSPIGVEVRRMPYMTALNLIVNTKNLMYEEKEKTIIIKAKDKVLEEEVLKDDTYADITAREVNISAVIFEANVQKTRDLGIDWKFLLSKNGVNFGSSLQTETIAPVSQQLIQATPPAFNLNTVNSHIRAGDWSGNVTAMFRFFESQSLGEIVTSPSVTVRNKQKGRIQIGSDFSVKQRDFSGNIIEHFYSSGSIIEVTPYIYNKKGIDYILLKLSVERSAFFPSDLTTEIKKTTATSDVLLLDGEQTAIGGLYINDEEIIRTGIPFLKDLPWWVLGIRYLTGSDQTIVTKKEVVILLKADLLNTLETRFSNKLQEKKNLIKEKIEKDEKELESQKVNYLENAK
jgi:type II secretory pathway component GspD/PulD (secretin)